MRTTPGRVLIVCFVSPRAALAQAWVPQAGEGSVSIDYQNFDSPGHLSRLGRKGGGGTLSHSVLFEVEYGITDRIALTAAVPFITAKYTGEGAACPLCVASELPFELLSSRRRALPMARSRTFDSAFGKRPQQGAHPHALSHRHRPQPSLRERG